MRAEPESAALKTVNLIGSAIMIAIIIWCVRQWPGLA